MGVGFGQVPEDIECGTEEADDVFSSAVNPAGTQALSGHRGGQILLWNLETGECLATLKGHSGIVYSVQITPDGLFAVSGSDDKTVKVWDLEAGTCVGTLEGHQNPFVIDSVAISPDGTLIASTGFTDKTVRLWDWKSGACLQVISARRNIPPNFQLPSAPTVRGSWWARQSLPSMSTASPASASLRLPNQCAVT
jgi:WD40 repeat protein